MYLFPSLSSAEYRPDISTIPHGAVLYLFTICLFRLAATQFVPADAAMRLRQVPRPEDFIHGPTWLKLHRLAQSSPHSLFVLLHFLRGLVKSSAIRCRLHLTVTVTAATAAVNLVNLKWRQIEVSSFYCESLRRLPSSLLLCVFQSGLMETDDTEANSGGGGRGGVQGPMEKHIVSVAESYRRWESGTNGLWPSHRP